MQNTDQSILTSVTNNKSGSDTDVGYYEREQHSGMIVNASTSGKCRKKIRKKSEWKRNVSKRNRNAGLSYISKSGKLIDARKLGKGCHSKCRYECLKKHFSRKQKRYLHIILENWQYRSAVAIPGRPHST